MGGRDDLSVAEIAALLNAQAKSLCAVLFPNGRELAGYFCVGSVDGEPGDSLKVHLRGNKAGGWSDFSRSRGERGGSGDMLALVQHVMGDGDMGRAVQWAKGWLGIEGGVDPGKLEKVRREAAERRETADRDEASKREATRRNAERLWRGASELGASPPALAYFAGRGIDFGVIGRFPRAIRYRGDVTHVELGRKVPAILCGMYRIDGTFAAVHRTYIDRTGSGGWIKHPGVQEAKKALGSFIGAHLPINKGRCRAPLRDIAAGTAVEASEGIEDALSVAMAFPDVRVVAAATLGNLATLELPVQAGDFTIICQRDPPGSPAEASLETAIAQQQLQARMQGSSRRVMGRWPAPGFKDFNDQLQGKMMPGAVL